MKNQLYTARLSVFRSFSQISKIKIHFRNKINQRENNRKGLQKKSIPNPFWRISESIRILIYCFHLNYPTVCLGDITSLLFCVFLFVS